ncbi:MAG: tripartite tricarboxylate transporter substrate binding protein [Limnohabitans sp.]|nr:tripartite tricarboxylate transporter substrate binding protein [Limnohabitans sp.]
MPINIQTKRRQLMTGVASATALAMLTPSQLLAQGAYPNRPLKMVVPWPPGQATDLAGRVVAQELSKFFGQSVVIDNKAGAGGTIGTDAVAKSTPDGYTILAASSGPVSISPLFGKTPYEPEKDLIPVAMVGISPYVLVTAIDFPAKDLREFVAVVKANPGKYSFASSGTGATAHLIAESFNASVGLKAVHVPYKGSIPALTDVISGQVAYCIETAASTMPFVRSGRLRAYGVSLEKGSAVTLGITPFASSTGIPGLAGFDLGAWLGIMVPTGTPSSVVERLSTAIEKIMPTPDVKQAFSNIAVDIDYRRADEYTRYLRFISTRFNDVIKTNNIKAE